MICLGVVSGMACFQTTLCGMVPDPNPWLVGVKLLAALFRALTVSLACAATTNSYRTRRATEENPLRSRSSKGRLCGSRRCRLLLATCGG